MIPKVIHYCWFGGNPMPNSALKCIESWKKFCPDYVIKEWNESNFDINCCDYIREAYESKKWAFVTDYVRLYAMVNEGGIYMDTDVEVLKPLDKFLCHKAFSGFESSGKIPTGIMACEKEYEPFKELLSEYNNRKFIMENGDFNVTTNVAYITNLFTRYGLKLDNSYQEVQGFVLYPMDYFCAKSFKTGIVHITDNTYTIHHFSGSWLTDEQKRLKEYRHMMTEKYGFYLGSVFYKIAKIFNRI